MRANWHPHPQILVTDGDFRPDGTFVMWPVHDTARLTEAFRRALLRLFVRMQMFDEEQAAGMLTSPHSGFHVHTAVWVPKDDRAFATRLARSCARNPVALERLTFDRSAKAVSYRSDKSEGPTAGTETADPLEFLASVLFHIPDKAHATARHYGEYANRPRGMRRQAEPVALEAPPEAARRWAALLQQIVKVDPLACPTCGGLMRVVAYIGRASVIDQLLTHLRTRAARDEALARSAIAQYGGRLVNPPRLNFLSRAGVGALAEWWWRCELPHVVDLARSSEMPAQSRLQHAIEPVQLPLERALDWRRSRLWHVPKIRRRLGAPQRIAVRGAVAASRFRPPYVAAGCRGSAHRYGV
jgi:hypothetical protein